MASSPRLSEETRFLTAHAIDNSDILIKIKLRNPVSEAPRDREI